MHEIPSLYLFPVHFAIYLEVKTFIFRDCKGKGTMSSSQIG